MRQMRAWAAVLLAMLVVASAAAAQQPAELVVRGRVLGPDDAPLAEQRVLLHRVDASGGATIAESASDSAGRFELRAPGSTDTAAIYFTASRYQGELYIGPPFKAHTTGTEQVLQVGVAATSASALMGEAPAGGSAAAPVGRPATSRNWLLLVIPLLGVIAVTIYTVASQNRIPPERALLIRVAELDERMATAPPAQRESLQSERARLVSLLRRS